MLWTVTGIGMKEASMYTERLEILSQRYRDLQTIKPNALGHLGREKVGNTQENTSFSLYLQTFSLDTCPQTGQ